MRIALFLVVAACGGNREATQACKHCVTATRDAEPAEIAAPKRNPSPREQGPAGPRIAWTLDANVTEASEFFVGWSSDRSLVVKDDDRVRVVRDGKVVWAVPVSASHSMLVGNMYIGEHEQENELVTVDLGARSIRTIPVRDGIEVLGRATDKVIVRTVTNEVYELSPATCSKPTCLKKIATLGDGPITDHIGVWRDAVVVADNQKLLVSDRRGTKLEVAFAAGNNNTIVDGDEALIVDGPGVAILSLPGCLKRGRKIEIGSTTDPIDGCIIAEQAEDWTSDLYPVRLPGGGVAYNQFGDEEQRTRSFGPGVTTWSVETGGVGDVVGDASFVYVVTLGLDDRGPVRLLALARATGHVAWQTDLAAVAPADPYVTFALRDHQLVVGVGPKLYALTTR